MVKRKVILLVVILSLLMAVGLWQQLKDLNQEENIPYGALEVAAKKGPGTVSANDVLCPI